jgi:hypothetical protein
MQFITLTDYVLLPYYIAAIYAFAYYLRNKNYPKNHPLRKYYIPGLTVKIVGAIFIGMIYQYYYHSGDTAEFFRNSKIINSSADESLTKWLSLVFRFAKLDDPDLYEYISQMEWYRDPSAYFVCSVTAIINIFTFNTYLPTSIIFAFLSFTGIWALFKTFYGIYPHLIKPIAVAILFIPSTIVWGSGIFKDTICIFGLGWLTYTSFRILVIGDFSFKNIIIAIISAWVIIVVKLYILLSFTPALLAWIVFYYLKRVRRPAERIFIKGVFTLLILGSLALILQYLENSLGKFSQKNILETSKSTRDWLSYMSIQEQGASYNLGAFSPTIEGMLTKFPAAVNVTFFRPYLWEAGKIIIMLSAIEALLFLIITLKIIFQLGVKKIWKSIMGDSTIQFCLAFSMIFAFAVGISSYNFGALSRYKIPCIPFFCMALMLMYYKNFPLKKKLIPFVNLA